MDHPSLSATDTSEYRKQLDSPLASQPYADGRQIPVLLVNGAGKQRELLGFIVTRETVQKAEVEVIPDNSPLVTRALAAAPIAIPELERADISDVATEQLGADWDVRFGRNKRLGRIALLLAHTSGAKFSLEFDHWPSGLPHFFTESGLDCTEDIVVTDALDWGVIGRKLLQLGHENIECPIANSKHAPKVCPLIANTTRVISAETTQPNAL